MDPDWKDRLERWCAERGFTLSFVLPHLQRSDWWEVARAQHLAGASDIVLWRLLDGAMKNGRPVGGPGSARLTGES